MYRFVQDFLGLSHRGAWRRRSLPDGPAAPVRDGRRTVGAAARVASVLASLRSGPAFAQGIPDPAGSGAIISAVNWLQGTLLGTVATIVAVIAVASVGFMMLTGRVNWRHGAVVILGCFILFGAASIVGGIRTAAAGG